jgi:alpha-beta hydrolase superfamily lysophospholipase
MALFAKRVTIPVLMVNGTEDAAAPLKTSVEPMYERLATDEQHKKLITYPGGHGLFALFNKQMIKDVLDWLDLYLGPVE